MSAGPITARQLQVLIAIHDLTREQDAPPTMRAVARRVGCSVEVAWEEIHALRARGHLAPAGRGVPRSLRLTNRGLRTIGVEPTVEVPMGLLRQALASLELQPRGGPNDWWPRDAQQRAEAKRALRLALGDVVDAEDQECAEWLASEAQNLRGD